MRLFARIGAVSGGLALIGTLAGCNAQLGTTSADGPRKQICGQDIGRAEDRGMPGPFYLDGSRSDVRYTAMAHSAGTWVQVSDDCGHGSVVSVPVTASAAICGRLPAGPGADLAILVAPEDPGTASVSVTHGDGSVTHVEVTVTTAIDDDVANTC